MQDGEEKIIKDVVTGDGSGIASKDEEQPSLNNDDDELWYPDGGKDAWLVCLGAWCAMVAGFGLCNTIGSIQAYISLHQLSDYNAAEIAWIPGLYIFLIFFFGLQIGPIFDAKGPRVLIFVGSICQVASVLLLGICTSMFSN